MSCQNLLGEEYGEEGGPPCGDEGQLCATCFQAEADKWRVYFAANPHFNCDSCGKLVEGTGSMCPACWEQDARDNDAYGRQVAIYGGVPK